MTKYAFICGCPRSGTTAITFLLSSHPMISLGLERYKYYANNRKINKINEELFSYELFFEFKEEQTNILPQNSKQYSDYYNGLKEKYRYSLIYGDKYPDYFQFYNNLKDSFFDAKFIYLLRDIYEVASSWNVRANEPNSSWPKHADYREAVKRWNESLKETNDFLKISPKNLFVCDYDSIFGNSRNYLEKLLKFIDIPLHFEIVKHYKLATKEYPKVKKKSKKITPDQSLFIKENANFILYEKIKALSC